MAAAASIFIKKRIHVTIIVIVSSRAQAPSAGENTYIPYLKIFKLGHLRFMHFIKSIKHMVF